MDLNQFLARVNGGSVRSMLYLIKKDYPLATMAGLKDSTGDDLIENLTGKRGDPFVLEVKHSICWLFRHNALPADRYSYNVRHDAKALAACVERWLAQDVRYEGLSITISPMAFVVAGRYCGMTESGGNWPFYRLHEHPIRRGYYSDEYEAHTRQYRRQTIF